jgi:hypothetical protein
MVMLADLHTHSAASDGQYSPEDLVRLAKARGIQVLALTDHDTTDGLAEAIEAGNRLGLRVIGGIELSACEYDTFHLLGYAVDPAAQHLSDLCRRMKDRRERRNPRILEFLKKQGIDLSMAQVREVVGGPVTGRPHFAQALVRYGYVSSNREAFDRYLDTEAYHQAVEGGKPPIRECIQAIRDAGGRASLAHPYQIGLSDEALDQLVGELAGCGLDAIECYYPKYTPEQQAFYLHLAKKYHLRVTGGSDFHGEKVKPDVALTPWDLELDWLM